MEAKRRKMGLVVGLFPDQYRIADPRLNKPVCHQEVEKGEVTGSMLLQEIDTVSIGNGREITYFCPNNVAVLLSTSSKALDKARELYEGVFRAPGVEFRVERVDEDKKTFLNKVSSAVCDYIEHVQTSIVFAYTALETFANLSIPEGYQYQTENKSRGIRETYDKDAIERWLSLKVKVQCILREIYETKAVERQKWWGRFSNLERYRNELIHQKTIQSTSFYKKYFEPSVFLACECPLLVIKFFYEAHAAKSRTNPIWPWLVNEKNYFPIDYQYDSENFEVVGNVYEGIKE
jgi:hypothetical protein